MNDRELLELAAKAAGFKDTEFDNLFKSAWNPLTDDSDALRLAVKLKITVRLIGHKAIAASCTQCDEYLDSDPYAATRRAIVRAAAAIGESL